MTGVHALGLGKSYHEPRTPTLELLLQTLNAHAIVCLTPPRLFESCLHQAFGEAQCMRKLLVVFPSRLLAEHTLLGWY